MQVVVLEKEVFERELIERMVVVSRKVLVAIV